MTDVDVILHELLVLEADVKVKVKRIDEIKTWCKQQGSFDTEMFVCAVKERSRTGLVSLQKAIDAIGEEILRDNNLIQTSTFLIVMVAARAEAQVLVEVTDKSV